MSPGSLIVVGTGIRAGVQLTPEARSAIEHADVVLFAVADPLAAETIRRLSPSAETLSDLYEPGLERRQVYDAMVERVMAPVRAGRSVCAAFYGHPGIFGSPAHRAVRQARLEGFEAEMLPGVSALDALFADLGIDPGTSGCQLYQAATFVRRRPAIDTEAVLVLWQAVAVGRTDVVTDQDRGDLSLLADRLLELFPPDREVICYEASPYPVGGAEIERVPLENLAATLLPALVTLVICPGVQADGAAVDAWRSSDSTAATATTLPLAE